MDSKLAAKLERRWNCRLTTIGRKSGQKRQVTIWFALEGDAIYLAGGADRPQWCRNIEANPEVKIEIGGAVLRGQGRVLEEGPAAEAIRERFVRRYLMARMSRLFGGYSRSVAVVVDLEASFRPDSDRTGDE